MNIDPFKEYVRQSEPGKREKGYVWNTAIGLQAVDGLKPSGYLIDTAIKNIEGDISIDEAQGLTFVYETDGVCEISVDGMFRNWGPYGGLQLETGWKPARRNER